MKCPVCFGTNISPVGTTHYICNNPNCKNINGKRTQFSQEIDSKVEFPYNQIYVNRGKENFYKLHYLK